MSVISPSKFWISRLLVGLSLAGLVACGGGSSLGVATPQPATAAGGLDRFNEWRAALGLSLLTREARLDFAAQSHSNYQALNDVISHAQTPGNPGYLAADAYGRIVASGYPLNPPNAIGEVISRMRNNSGAQAADELIKAIYHRFVVFEPMFTQAGAGAASSARNDTYLTVKFTAPGLSSGIGRGNIVVFPVDGQTNVPRNFFSDTEVPDPVPGLNEVGYPISIHADIWSPAFNRAVVVQVTNFSVRPVGGELLAVRNLWSSVDGQTPFSVAAIVPLAVLGPQTDYEAGFSGTVDGVAVNRTWRFRTGS